MTDNSLFLYRVNLVAMVTWDNLDPKDLKVMLEETAVLVFKDHRVLLVHPETEVHLVRLAQPDSR